MFHHPKWMILHRFFQIDREVAQPGQQPSGAQSSKEWWLQAGRGALCQASLAGLAICVLDDLAALHFLLPCSWWFETCVGCPTNWMIKCAQGRWAEALWHHQSVMALLSNPGASEGGLGHGLLFEDSSGAG